MKTTIIVQNFGLANMPPCHAELEKSLKLLASHDLKHVMSMLFYEMLLWEQFSITYHSCTLRLPCLIGYAVVTGYI